METLQEEIYKSRDPRKDIAAGIFLAVWCVSGWWSVADNPALWTSDYGADPGPGLLPAIVLTILSMGSLCIILGGLRRAVREPEILGCWWRFSQWRDLIIPAILVVTLLIYFPMIKMVGFIPASTFFTFGWMVSLGFKCCKGGVKVLLLQSIVGTLIGVGLIYFVFVRLIGVPLR